MNKEAIEMRVRDIQVELDNLEGSADPEERRQRNTLLDELSELLGGKS